MVSVFDNEAAHQSTISRWYRELKSGQISLSDDPRAGPPTKAVTQENVETVHKPIQEDHIS